MLIWSNLPVRGRPSRNHGVVPPRDRADHRHVLGNDISVVPDPRAEGESTTSARRKRRWRKFDLKIRAESPTIEIGDLVVEHRIGREIVTLKVVKFVDPMRWPRALGNVDEVDKPSVPIRGPDRRDSDPLDRILDLGAKHVLDNFACDVPRYALNRAREDPDDRFAVLFGFLSHSEHE